MTNAPSQSPVIGMVEMGCDPFRRYMKNKYLRALSAFGARPVMLPDTSDKEALSKAFASCDGLLLPGGADISPSLYGENVHPKCGSQSETRDLSEPFLLSLALEQGKPVLGITDTWRSYAEPAMSTMSLWPRMACFLQPAALQCMA